MNKPEKRAIADDWYDSAAIVIIMAIIVATASFWLAGMP